MTDQHPFSAQDEPSQGQLKAQEAGDMKEPLPEGMEGEIEEPPPYEGWEPEAPRDDGAPPDYYTAIKDDLDLSDVPPPPEYIPPEVQGVSKDNPETNTPSLGYADFLPRCLRPGNPTRSPVFDNIKSLIGFVNQWLQVNVQFVVVRCETIRRKVKENGTIEIDSTSYHQSIYGNNDYIRGLRLWLLPRPSGDNSVPQQLAYVNIVPKDLPPQRVAVSFGGRRRGIGMTGMLFNLD